MNTTSPARPPSLAHLRDRHLLQWRLCPEGDGWKITIEGRGMQLVEATAPSHLAARSFALRARELYLGRASLSTPVPVAWTHFPGATAVALRSNNGRSIQLAVEELDRPKTDANPFRFRWWAEALDAKLSADGVATSFLHAELLASAAADMLTGLTRPGLARPRQGHALVPSGRPPHAPFAALLREVTER